MLLLFQGQIKGEEGLRTEAHPSKIANITQEHLQREQTSVVGGI